MSTTKNSSDMRKEIYDIVFAAQYEGLSTKEATEKLLALVDVSGSISAGDVVLGFMDWMKSDDCWVNDKDGNKIPYAEIDGKNFTKYMEKYYR